MVGGLLRNMVVWLWLWVLCGCFVVVGKCLAVGMAVCGCFEAVEWCLW